MLVYSTRWLRRGLQLPDIRMPDAHDMTRIPASNEGAAGRHLGIIEPPPICRKAIRLWRRCNDTDLWAAGV